MIDPIQLSKQELAQCYKIMRTGNTQLRHLAEVTGMEQRKFRAKLFKNPFNPADWPELNEVQLAEFEPALADIQAVRDIEWKMMRQFARLAYHQAKNWNGKFNRTLIDRDDYQQEALMALLDAIYSYTKEEIKFITFATCSIHNRLYTAANKGNLFSPLTNEAIDLLKRFELVKNKFNRYVTDQEIYEVGEFTKEECEVIREAQVKMSNSSFFSNNQDTDAEQSTDYTALRAGIDQERDTVQCNYEIREAMQYANLTDIERQVVETSLCPHYGWQTELAKATINQRTGKPVTKTTIGHILKKALDKIKKTYLRKAVA